MDASEANNIPKESDITDVDIYEHFSAEVIEMHKLGDKISNSISCKKC